MSFIRSKTRATMWGNRWTKYSIVENVRDGEKVRQKVLLYLGPCDTVEGAIAHFREQAAHYSDRALGWGVRHYVFGKRSYELFPITKAEAQRSLRIGKKFEKSAARCERYLRKHGIPLTVAMFVCGCGGCVSARRERLSNGPCKFTGILEEARGLAELPVVPNSVGKSSAQLGTTSGLKGKS